MNRTAFLKAIRLWGVIFFKEWEPFLQELSAIEPLPDFVLASGSLPPGAPADFYAQVARTGKKRGTKTIIDASGEPLEQALQEGVYLIKPNVREFRELVGKDIKEESQIKAEARKMVKGGRCEVLVISLGAAGALAVSGTSPSTSCRPPCRLSARSAPETAWWPVSS